MKTPSFALLSSFFAAFIALPALAFAQAFLDVPSDRWSYEFIEKLVQADAVDESDRFYPDREATRAEVAEMLVRATVPKERLNSEGAQAFKDVPPSHLQNKYINTAHDLGWVKGYADSDTGEPTGYYGPEDHLLRAEIVTLIVRAIYSTLPEADKDGEAEKSPEAPMEFKVPAENAFSDVEADSWYEPYVYKAQELGLVNGYKDESGNLTGEFGPGDELTREQLAKIIALAMDLIIKNLEEQMALLDPYKLDENSPIGVEIRPVIEKETFSGGQYVALPSEKTFVAGSKNNYLASYDVKSIANEDLVVAKLTFDLAPAYAGEGIAPLSDLLDSATLRYKDKSGLEQSQVAYLKGSQLSFEGMKMHASSSFSKFDLLFNFKDPSTVKGAFSGNPVAIKLLKDADLADGYIDLAGFYAENLSAEKTFDGKAKTIQGQSTSFTLRHGRPILSSNDAMEAIEGQSVTDGEFKLLSFDVKADPQGGAVAFGSFGIQLVAVDADPNNPLNLGDFRLYKNGKPTLDEAEIVADLPEVGNPEGFVYFVFRQKQVIQPGSSASYAISTTVSNSESGDLLAVYFSPHLEARLSLANSPNPFKTTGYLVGSLGGSNGVLAPMEALKTDTKKYLSWSDSPAESYSIFPGAGSYFWTNGFGLSGAVEFLYASWQKK